MIWLKGIPWRLIGFGIVLAAAGAGLWKINEWRNGSLERDAAIERADAAEKRSVEIAENFAKGAAVNQDIAKVLTDFRGEEERRGLELAQAIKDSKRPIIREVTYVDPKTGAKNTCYQRDPVRYGELFNEAVGPAYP